jgi:hypothetical protein
MLVKIFCCALLLTLLCFSPTHAARFNDNGDQTVTDTQTGLTWTKDANLPGTDLDYSGSLDFVAAMNGSHSFGYQDWRLPAIDELASLIDHNRSNPSLPAGHPFSNVAASYYWSATQVPGSDLSVMNWEVDFYFGNLSSNHTWNNDLLWPVRGTMGGSGAAPTSSLPAGLTGAAYHQAMVAGFGFPPYSWSLVSGSLPAGLSLNPGSGVLAGAALRPGVYSFSVQATDSLGSTKVLRLALTVSDLLCSFAPVRIDGATPVSYNLFSDAYAWAAQGASIQLAALDFNADLILNRELQLRLTGGYNCGYTGIVASAGILGALQVSRGTVNLANLRFK